jgi:dTMP kinase
VARGLGVAEVLEVNLAATGRLLPDRTIVIELPRDVAAARRDGAADRMESEADAFHAAVADGFADVARRFPERIAVVDGAGQPEDVAARVRAEVAL